MLLKRGTHTIQKNFIDPQGQFNHVFLAFRAARVIIKLQKSEVF